MNHLETMMGFVMWSATVAVTAFFIAMTLDLALLIRARYSALKGDNNRTEGGK